MTPSRQTIEPPPKRYDGHPQSPVWDAIYDAAVANYLAPAGEDYEAVTAIALTAALHAFQAGWKAAVDITEPSCEDPEEYVEEMAGQLAAILGADA